ncbi:unnamed protein product [Chrysoparadoxa australica]
MIECRRGSLFLPFPSLPFPIYAELQTGGILGEVLSVKAATYVSRLLPLIEPTNRGLDATKEQREKIDHLVNELGDLGKTVDWLKESIIFGNYNVAYVSTGDSQNGNPAGGRFRSSTILRKLVFPTTNLFQHLVEPNTVVNMVEARLFWLLPICITLRGTFQPAKAVPNAVDAVFEKPALTWRSPLSLLALRFGPSNSTVQIETTYADDRVRIGRGSQGSLFIFTRGGAADKAHASRWRRYSRHPAVPPKVLGVSILGAAAFFVPPSVAKYGLPPTVAALALWRPRRRSAPRSGSAPSTPEKEEAPAAEEQPKQA